MIVAATVAGAALAGGLAWLVAPGGSGGPATVNIRAFHSRFEPDRVTVQPGSTVRFVISNADPIDHEFILGPPQTHDIHERGEPHFHTGAVAGEVTVPAGTTVETTWTFAPAGSPDPGGRGVSPRQGPPSEVVYGCHLAGHFAYGMHGKALLR